MNNRHLFPSLFVTALALTGAARAQNLPLGLEFQIPAYTTEFPSRQQVAALPGGGFIVVWTDDIGGRGVVGQRFDGIGQRAGEEFVINGDLHHDVVADGKGNFVVVFDSLDADGDGVFGQRFEASGAKVGPQFQVNTYTTGDQSHPRVAMNESGEFVVVWESYGQDGSYDGVFGQKFDASGARVGTEFAAPSNTLGTQISPVVGVDRAGNFVVCWTSYGGAFGAPIFGQRFDAAASKVGLEFQVSDNGPRPQRFPGVAVHPAGDFLVAWEDDYDYPYNISARRFNVSGEKVGAQFTVNNETEGRQSSPGMSASVDRLGHFVVVWLSQAVGGGKGKNGLDGRVFDRRAQATGAQFAFTTSGISPRVAATDAGPVAVWGTGEEITGRRQIRTPIALHVDEEAGASTSSDRNGVLEEGEIVRVEPSWTNHDAAATPLVGTTPALTPCLPGHACLTAMDGSADYGTIAPGANSNCAAETPSPCFVFTVSGARPGTHWDESFTETLSAGGSQLWTLHIGDSFSDVPRAEPFYRKIETLFHNGITSGCSETQYCPGVAVPRDQMAIFIGKALAGAADLVPTTGLVGGQTYNCASGGHSLFTDVAPTDLACRQIHYLAFEKATAGCSASAYCPGQPVSRDAMASFIAKALVAPGGGAAVPETYGPDHGTGRSYSCAASSPSLHFTDVPASNAFCKHIHYLWARGIVDGCSATKYCPVDVVNRDAMAKFIVNAFGLQLYGP